MTEVVQFPKTIALMKSVAEDRSVPASQLCIMTSSGKQFTETCGWIDPENQKIPARNDTLFDLASVTKLFTTATFMQLCAAGEVMVDDPVSALLPDFVGFRQIKPFEEPLISGAFRDVSDGFTGPVDAEKITFRQLLSHSSGIPAWRPLYLEPDVRTAKQAVLKTFFSYEPGTNVVYSDLNLMLIGWSIEALTGLSLDNAVRQLVTEPLNLRQTRFVPKVDSRNPVAIAPTEICHWRKRRLIGEADDENAGFFNGVLGHAGLFTTASDLASFGAAFLPPFSFLPFEVVFEMTHSQAISKDGLMNRGIGFQLWSNDSTASFFPFSTEVFGHTGFTGTCLWVDPQREISVALLTNEVWNGRYNRKIAPFRLSVFKSLLDELEQNKCEFLE